MKKFVQGLRQTVVAGFFFLFPLYVVFIVIAKAWTSLSSMGTKLAAMFGVKSILGVGGTTIFSALLIIIIWLICGLLMRFSFIGAFSRSVEKTISSLIPGYAAYRAVAEEKLEHKKKPLPYASALVKQQNSWQPSFVVDQDSSGNFVIFIPDIPDTSKGRVLIASEDQVQLVPSLTANALDDSLKKMGHGLLDKCPVSQKLP